MFSRDNKIARYALILFFVLLSVYAYYEARAMLYGPQIHVPADAMIVEEAYTEIRGQASYISELRLNGALVPVTEEGKFAEEYLLAPGENRLIFDAKDTFGRETQEIVTVYYKPKKDSSPTPSSETLAATSSTATVITN